MTAARARLLYGPYHAPALRVGSVATCLVRDCDVKVTAWTDAPIPWPMGVPVGGRSRPAIVVDDELARAIRHESAAALRHWWGVGAKTAWRWRKALDVTRTNNEGTTRLIRAAAEKGASRTRGKRLPPDQVERRRRSAVEMDMGSYLPHGYHGPRWTPDELAMLGTDTDEAIAARIGRSVEAVRIMRDRLGIPRTIDRRRRGYRRPSTS